MKQIVKANLENHYRSELCHLFQTNPLVKKINCYHFSHFLVNSNNFVF